MQHPDDAALRYAVGAAAQPWESQEAEAARFENLRSAHTVLIGEATHGTAEFYAERARLTRWLIEAEGFGGVAVEADWPDAYRVHRYVLGGSDDATAESALGDFERFPAWMWRNTEVVAFVAWLKAFNDAHPGRRVGFYGLDLYSLYRSMAAVIDYLDRVDPAAARRARFRYGCFEHFGPNPEAYGYGTHGDLDASCQQETLHQLLELRQQAAAYLQRDGFQAADEQFFAEQNAQVALDAEAYYRAMFAPQGERAWNVRDTHMADSLDALRAYLSRRPGAVPTTQVPKLVVWAHNSHIGDQRATELHEHGQVNLCQLVRERHGAQETMLLGLTTYEGFVTAATQWDSPALHQSVRPARSDSYEALFHQVAVATGTPNFSLDLRPLEMSALRIPRLSRAIGVLYLPRTERQSHYFRTSLTRQFDALLHLDRTRAVEPLEPAHPWVITRANDMPETYPSTL